MSATQMKVMGSDDDGPNKGSIKSLRKGGSGAGPVSDLKTPLLPLVHPADMKRGTSIALGHVASSSSGGSGSGERPSISVTGRMSTNSLNSTGSRTSTSANHPATGTGGGADSKHGGGHANDKKVARFARSRTTMLLFADEEGSEPDDSDDEKAAAGLPVPYRTWQERIIRYLERSRFVLSLRNPTGDKRRVWNALIFLFLLYNVLSLPLRLAFHEFWNERASTLQLWMTIDYIGDVFFWLDIGLGFVTPYFDDGFLITDDKSIANHYLKGYFTLDLISTLPLDAIDYVVWRHALLRLPRLLRLVKYETYFKIWEQSAEGEKAHILRFVKLLLGLLLIIHWLGCVYIALGYLRGFNTEWLPEPEVKEMSMSSQYLYGVFWSANILTGVGGEPERPTNDVERIITLLVALIAIFVVAIIIGNVSELVSEANVNDEKFRQKMDEIGLFMRNRRLDEELQTRIRQYYTNIWSRKGGLDDSTILSELPVSLRSEVSVTMHRDIIQKVPLFQHCSPGFIHSLVSYLQPQIYSPRDMLVREGDVGHEMYFIRKGKVNVIVTDKVTQKQKVVGSLGEGMYFGEIALLEENSIRTATIQAAAFCDLFVLTRDDLQSVFKSFPEEKGVLKGVAAERKARDQLRATLSVDPLFAGCNDSFLKAVVNEFKSLKIDEVNQHLFGFTERATAIYFVAKGQVTVCRATTAEAKAAAGAGTPTGNAIAALQSVNAGAAIVAAPKKSGPLARLRAAATRARQQAQAQAVKEGAAAYVAAEKAAAAAAAAAASGSTPPASSDVKAATTPGGTALVPAAAASATTPSAKSGMASLFGGGGGGGHRARGSIFALHAMAAMEQKKQEEETRKGEPFGICGAGLFVGEIQPEHNYSVAAQTYNEPSEMLLLEFNSSAWEQIQEKFPDDQQRVALLLKRYRFERDYYYHNERTLEQKRHDVEAAAAAAAAASHPTGIVTPAGPPASASSGAGGIGIAAASTPIAIPPSGGVAGSGASHLPSTGLSFVAGSHSTVRTSTFTPVAVPGGSSDGRPKNWKRFSKAGESNSASGVVAYDERWKSKVPLGFVAAARFLRSDAPNSVVSNPNFDIKSQWLRRLSTLNTPMSEKEMESLTNDEILLADHCAHIMTQLITEQLFHSADDRDDE